MADNESFTDPPNHLTDGSQLKHNFVRLKYPTIDLQASLESLLSSPTLNSSEPSTIMAPDATSPPTMDESWASLDVSDLAHDDDDTQSENTDVGSLVDLSSAHDTESAIEDESQSETGMDEERMMTSLPQGMLRNSEQAGQPEMQEKPTYETVEDTIILRRATIEAGGDAVDLEYIKPLSTDRGQPDCLRETIHMTVSQNTLNLPDHRPIRVCYYGNSSCQYTKDDLLGKIGAALVSPLSATSSRTSLASTCFNIIPSEFGPGSKPAFADLIPSQAQMALDELVLVDSDFDIKQSDNIRFLLNRGTVYESKSINPHARYHEGEWRPDLVVIQVGHEDADDEFVNAIKILKLAERHFWPTIVVAEDSSVRSLVLRRHIGIHVQKEFQNEHGSVHVQCPIDLDSFMAIDTDQLSHHIEYIIDENLREDRKDKRLLEQRSTLSKVMHRFSFSSTTGDDAERYILEVVEPEPKSAPRIPARDSRLTQAKQFWSGLSYRNYAKDLFFMLVVMILGVYIVGFPEKSYSEIIVCGGSDTVMYDHGRTDINRLASTATVTATMVDSSHSVVTAISRDHDIVMYDPVSFDHMWHRLTGRPTSNHEDEKPVEEVRMVKTTDIATGNDDESRSNGSMVQFIADWLLPNSDTIRKQVPSGMLHNAANSIIGLERQCQLREMRQKLQDLYHDASKNIPSMVQSGQKYLKSLVSQSSHHLRQARGAGEKGLEGLISEQKRALFRAQHQAQQLAPPIKKRSFFRRG